MNKTSAVTLTERQDAIVDYVIGLQDQEEQVIVTIDGPAGSGKTTMLRAIIAELRDYKLDYSLCAPTHKAARRLEEVLRDMKQEARTIHSVIYCGVSQTRREPEILGTMTSEDIVRMIKANPREFETIDPNSDTLVEDIGLLWSRSSAGSLIFNKRGKHTCKEAGKYMIIDEASMIDDALYTDIVESIPPTTHIIALGDQHQLPPVKQSASAFDLSKTEYRLTKVHRQKGTLLEAVTFVREQKAVFCPMNKVSRMHFRIQRKLKNLYGVAVMNLKVAKLASVFLEDASPSKVIICGLHETRVTMNTQIREMIYGDNDLPPQVGETVMIYDSVDQAFKKYETFVVSRVKEVRFAKSYTGYVIYTRCGELLRVLKDQWLGVYDSDSPSTQGLIPKSLRRKVKKIKNLVGIAPGHAITCHSSQGSQYDSCYVVADIIGFMRNNAYRFCYTALSRASKCATVVNIKS